MNIEVSALLFIYLQGGSKKVSCCTVSTAYFFEPPCRLYRVTRNKASTDGRTTRKHWAVFVFCFVFFLFSYFMLSYCQQFKWLQVLLSRLKICYLPPGNRWSKTLRCVRIMKSIKQKSVPNPDLDTFYHLAGLISTKYTKSYITLFLKQITLKFYEAPADCEALAIGLACPKSGSESSWGNIIRIFLHHTFSYSNFE